MNFIKTNIDTTDKKQVYRLTKGDSLKVQDITKGTVLDIDLFGIYTEEKTRKKNDGTLEAYTDTVLAFTSNGKKYGTISQTFIKSFIEIVELMDGEPFSIVITGGKSKNGREYVNCELDCE